MICLDFPDVITLVKTTVNAYGKPVYNSEADVNCVFIRDTGFLQSAHQNAIDSDAIAYCDPSTPFLITNKYRVEEYLVVVDWNEPEQDSWYKVTSVAVHRDSQLTNQIDSVELTLKKTTGIARVS